MFVVVEGASDEAAARRVVETAGHGVDGVYVKHGTGNLDPLIPNYARAAQRQPWVVFRDSDGTCPVELRGSLLAEVTPNPLFQLRIVHSMMEAWLLADRGSFASYFRVSVDRIPTAPEEEQHAKRTLLRLCHHSTSRDIRKEMTRSEDQAGPLFVLHLQEFARDHWDVDVAAQHAPSLRRAITALAALPRA